MITFDYKDAKGKETKRKAIVLGTPQDNYFCIDVAELEIVDVIGLEKELNAAIAEAKRVREEIMHKYDVSKNYRYFKPTGMTSIQVEA